jgi:hypothetical protein
MASGQKHCGAEERVRVELCLWRLVGVFLIHTKKRTAVLTGTECLQGRGVKDDTLQIVFIGMFSFFPQETGWCLFALDFAAESRSRFAGTPHDNSDEHQTCVRMCPANAAVSQHVTTSQEPASFYAAFPISPVTWL